MLVILLLAGLAIVGGVVLAALGRAGEMAAFPGDGKPLELGAGAVSPTDVALLRPPTALWGYQVQATEEALGTIARSMAARDAEIAALRWQLDSLRERGAAAAARSATGQEAAEPPWATPGDEPSPWTRTSGDMSAWAAAGTEDEPGWGRHGDEPAAGTGGELAEGPADDEQTGWPGAGGPAAGEPDARGPAAGEPAGWPDADEPRLWPEPGGQVPWPKQDGEPAGSPRPDQEDASPWSTGEGELTAWATGEGADRATPAGTGEGGRAAPGTGEGDWTAPGEDDWAAPGEDNWTAPGEDSWTAPGDDGWTAPGDDGWTAPGDDGRTAPGDDVGTGTAGDAGTSGDESEGQQPAPDTGEDVPAAREPANRSASRTGGTGPERPPPTP